MGVITGFAVLFFLVFSITLLIGLIKPSVFKIKGKPLDRKSASLYSLIGIIVSLIIVGVTAPEPEVKAEKVEAKVQEKAVKPEKEEEVKELPIEEKEVVLTLNMTPVELRKELNKQIEEKNISDVELFKAFDLKKAGDGEMFQYELANGKIILSGITAPNGELKEVFFVMAGLKSSSEMINGMALPILTAQILNKSVDIERNNKAVIDLITKAADGIEKPNNHHNKDVGDLTYYSLASPEMGFWIGFKPKKS
jgi:uncharacterized membrane protein YcgQ (UPF0703/DUF1980 family)